LANGTIANVNQNTHPDLYFALRGGGNNFGIVTRFDLETHRQGLMWGGTNLWTIEDLDSRRATIGLRDEFKWTLHSIRAHFASLLQRGLCRLGYGVNSADIIDAFVTLSREEQKDSAAHAYVFFTWLPGPKAYIVGATYVYSQPMVKPPVFEKFTSLKNVYSTMRLANVTSFTDEVESHSPAGDRQVTAQCIKM
jgi:hypothetical protein